MLAFTSKVFILGQCEVQRSFLSWGLREADKFFPRVREVDWVSPP